jgi:hypothetical protein
MDTIAGDLKQEIAAGSNATLYTDANGNVVGEVYLPINGYTAVPALALKGAQNSVTSFALNLVKRSAYQQNFFPGGSDTGASNYASGTAQTVALTGTTTSSSAGPSTPSNRAANLPSTAPAQNGRYISAPRWNKALLLPKGVANQTSDTDLTPDATQFVAPDWVLVARDGSNPTGTFNSNMTWSTTASSSVVGRYAYAIYDEGGLLDANLAGYPLNGSAPYTAANSDLVSSASKGMLAFADLTQLPGISALSASRQQAVVNALVGWRNFASGQASGSLASGYTFAAPSPSPWPYSLAMLGNPHGFLQTGNTADPQTTGGQTDRMFASRQELLSLLLNAVALQGNAGQSDRANLQAALQYLGTFSRGLNQPSYVPAVHQSTSAPRVLGPNVGGNAANTFDQEINSNYLTVRALKAFTRNDGSAAAVGDPLVSKRFPLQRLAWLTCKGPSNTRSQTDPDIQALMQNGITWNYLQCGTAANIQASFGLSWDGQQWLYNVHNNSVATGKGAIMRVGRDPAKIPAADPTRYVQDLNQPRDPDFFELLKSAITVGSLGKTLVNSNVAVTADQGSSPGEQPLNYNYDVEASVDRQVMQIGANIIGQSRVDNLPVRIVFDDGVGNRDATNPSASSSAVIIGVSNLPYLYNVTGGVLQVRAPSLLPRYGINSTPTYNGAPGTGTAGNSGYQPDPTPSNPSASSDAALLTDSGVGVIMQMPVIWNPHDPNSPVIAPALASSAAQYSPTQFRVLADSTTPDQVQAGAAAGSYSAFFAYGVSLGTPQGSFSSYQASGASPNNTWYRSASATGKEISAPITAANSAIYVSLSTSALHPLLPQPTLLWRAGTFTDLNGNGVPRPQPLAVILSRVTPVTAVVTELQRWPSPPFHPYIQASAKLLPAGSNATPSGLRELSVYSNPSFVSVKTM